MQARGGGSEARDLQPHGVLAQSGERLDGIQKVAGAKPADSTHSLDDESDLSRPAAVAEAFAEADVDHLPLPLVDHDGLAEQIGELDLEVVLLAHHVEPPASVKELAGWRGGQVDHEGL